MKEEAALEKHRFCPRIFEQGRFIKTPPPVPVTGSLHNQVTFLIKKNLATVLQIHGGVDKTSLYVALPLYKMISSIFQSFGSGVIWFAGREHQGRIISRRRDTRDPVRISDPEKKPHDYVWIWEMMMMNVAFLLSCYKFRLLIAAYNVLSLLLGLYSNISSLNDLEYNSFP